MSYKGVPHKVSYKSVLQKCPARVSDKSVLQEGPTRVHYLHRKCNVGSSSLELRLQDRPLGSTHVVREAVFGPGRLGTGSCGLRTGNL